MTTKRVETKVYTEHMYCECGGEMKQQQSINGSDMMVTTSLAVWPPRYYHYCDKCNKCEGLTETYPRLVYEEVEVIE